MFGACQLLHRRAERFAKIRWIAFWIRVANEPRLFDSERDENPPQLIKTGVRGVGADATGRTWTGTSAYVVPSSPTRIT